jgi:hypothetical protein
MSHHLVVPPNITILPLPAKCPELNPVENVRQFMRDNWLSNRVFHSYNAIVDHCCEAWNKLTDQPWRIMSIGMRDWAYRFRSVQAGISGFYNIATGVLTLSGTASVANYQSALDSITYSFSPANGNPTGGGGQTTRTISWVVNDGTNSSSAATRAPARGAPQPAWRLFCRLWSNR